MDAGTIALLIPIAAIVMGGLVKISSIIARSNRRPDVSPLDGRVEALEHELDSFRRELSETHERLDFAERLLARSREGKGLGAPET
ncbi:MAG: hypothetical protein ACREL3_01785 [Gemmatimonadales bacterium]